MTRLHQNENIASSVHIVEKPFSDIEEFYAVHFHGLTIQLYAYTGDLGAAQDCDP